ncbi:copper transporter [Nocardioides caricicola]|uniref:Copper transporter n=1 Tax=Nocardioides caricicola TaxID=634770 RepID=A0ABW0MWV8_9ACTN
MISYRHHIVSLVAVFLALAVGVALGGGPLSDLGRDDKPASAPTSPRKQPAAKATYGDEFASAGAAALYANGLRDRSVSLVTLPGADADVVSALGAEVEAAGGTIAGTYDVLPALTDASEKSLVDTLGSQLADQLGSGAVSADAPTYERMGQLLGLAVSGSSDLPSSEAEAVRQGLAGAELMGSPEDAARAPAVLVVLGDSTNPAILTGVVTGLADKATGVVVAGSADVLTDLRSESDGRAATVDGVDQPLGQVTAVLAVIRSFSVQGGSFGASGSDGAVPLT